MQSYLLVNKSFSMLSIDVAKLQEWSLGLEYWTRLCP
jgi:hypothetical protein